MVNNTSSKIKIYPLHIYIYIYIYIYTYPTCKPTGLRLHQLYPLQRSKMPKKKRKKDCPES